MQEDEARSSGGSTDSQDENPSQASDATVVDARQKLRSLGNLLGDDDDACVKTNPPSDASKKKKKKDPTRKKQ